MPLITTSVRDTARAEYLVRKGIEARALGDDALALARFREALACDPEDDTALYACAQLEAAVGGCERAVALLLEAIGRRPAHPEGWNLLGVLLFEGGDRESAVRCWKRALELAPALKAAKRNLRRHRSGVPARPSRAALSEGDRERLLARRPPRLTACLIVRDEAEMLGPCLDSLRGIADEVVVVDTGSVDGTPDLARARGARVVFRPWDDDFSAARNEALRHARGDWILSLDADERLLAEDGARLRAFLAAGKHDYANVAIESSVEGETLTTKAIRLFRNLPGLLFFGRVHEQIAPSLREIERRFPLRGGEAPVRLSHLGYDPRVFAARGKAERNARLLAHEMRERPANAYAHLKHGELLFSQGRLDEAGPEVEKAWKLTREAIAQGAPASLLEEPATLRAACAVARGEHGAALETLEEFHRACAPTINTLYLEGVALWALGRPGAADRIRRVVERPPAEGELFTLPEARGGTPRFVLGSIALDAGDLPAARDRFEETLRIAPAHREARLGLAETHFRLGETSRAVAMLAALLDEDGQEIRAWRSGGVFLLATSGLEEAARAWLEAGCALFPEDAILARLRADLERRPVAVPVSS